MEPRASEGDAVWVSRLLLDPETMFGFTCEERDRDKDQFLKVVKKFVAGEALDDAELPDVMWVSFAEDDRRKTLPHIFKVNDFVAVSSQMADVLRGFDLGRSRLVPVRLMHADRETPFPGEHFLLHIREDKAGFEPDHSARFKRPKRDWNEFLGKLELEPEDNDVSVNPGVLAGSDLWYDRTLMASLFASDALMAAMRAAKVLGRTAFFRCPVLRVS